MLTTRGHSKVLQVLRGYESKFGGYIREERDCACAVSWPGIYAKSWDALVAEAKTELISAAVVFLPQHTASFGKHGSDKCYCVEVSITVRQVLLRRGEYYSETSATA
jgi:hypothetical protein